MQTNRSENKYWNNNTNKQSVKPHAYYLDFDGSAKQNIWTAFFTDMWPACKIHALMSHKNQYLSS